MVRIGDTKMRARTKSPKRMIEDVFIVRSIKELIVLTNLLMLEI